MSTWTRFSKKVSISSPMCRTALIRSALESLDLGASNGVQNVQIRHFWTDMGGFKWPWCSRRLDLNSNGWGMGFWCFMATWKLPCQSRSVGFARFAHRWTRQALNFPAHFESALCDTSPSLWKLFLKNWSRSIFWSKFEGLRYEILELHCHFKTAYVVPKVSDLPFSHTIRTARV